MTNATTPKNRPVETLRGFGGIKLNIWSNPTPKGGVRYSLDALRSYKGPDEQFHDTRYFNAEEALQVAVLIQRAYFRIKELAAANPTPEQGNDVPE